MPVVYLMAIDFRLNTDI